MPDPTTTASTLSTPFAQLLEVELPPESGELGLLARQGGGENGKLKALRKVALADVDGFACLARPDKSALACQSSKIQTH